MLDSLKDLRDQIGLVESLNEEFDDTNLKGMYQKLMPEYVKVFKSLDRSTLSEIIPGLSSIYEDFKGLHNFPVKLLEVFKKYEDLSNQSYDISQGLKNKLHKTMTKLVQVFNELEEIKTEFPD